MEYNTADYRLEDYETVFLLGFFSGFHGGFGRRVGTGG